VFIFVLPVSPGFDRLYRDVVRRWRQVLPGSFRHIAVMSSTDGGATFSSPKIVSDDRRVLQGCPALGPSLSVDSGGKLKVLWFAAGEGNPPGLYFAESSDKGNASHRASYCRRKPFAAHQL
jgi:hypothetical protein